MIQSRCRTTERIEITKTTKKEICITRRRQGSIMKNTDAERMLKKKNYEQLKKLEYSQQWMTVGDQCEIILTQVNRWRFCYQLEVRRYPLVRIEALQ